MIERILLVTGGRRFTGREFLWAKLTEWQPDLIIHGDAMGADALADNWARGQGIPRAKFGVAQKQWSLYGMQAAKMRNGQMVDFARMLAYHDTAREVWDALPYIEGLAMPGNQGTADMCERMSEAGITYWDYRDDPAALRYYRP
jgi:hypothetical protein